MDLLYRKGEMTDLERLAEIDGLGDSIDRQRSEKQLPQFIKAKRLMCVEVSGQIVGLLYWTENFFNSDNWYLSTIAIEEVWRQKGIGEKLWKYFLDFAKEDGVHKVFCDIRQKNSVSQKLARKLGAKKVGSLDLDYGVIKYFYRFDLH